MTEAAVNRKAGWISFFLVLTIIAVFSYLAVRTFLFILAPYFWYEKIAAMFLLLAEGFILIHSFGYFLNVYRVIKHSGTQKAGVDIPDTLHSYPPVAVIVSSFKEPLDVLEDTITCFYNLTYPNKRIYFLDDTRYDLPGQDREEMEKYRRDIENLCSGIGVHLFRRTWRGAKAGMINDFLDFIEGKPKEGFTFFPFGGEIRGEKEKYIIVFDADMNPFPDFIEPLVAIMEHNPKLAFVQTPQYYSNFEKNRVARGSGLQQAIFYEYICEGKSIQDAMFCCGTNVIFRREALTDVGGFDESSVTEDFATSLRFHKNGWQSAYVGKVCAFGMGPEDLGGYFKQQFRWALGTVGLFREILKNFMKNPGMLPPSKWWEYFLSGTHYFVGWVFFTLVYCPILYLFFNVPSYLAYPHVFFLFFTPYIILSLTLFAATLRSRRYTVKDMLQGVLLNAVSFPVYMKASLLAMLGVKGTFGITPKSGSNALPLTALWPQILTLLIAFGAVVWGIHRLIYEREAVMAVVINSFWSLYHVAIILGVFYFNYPVETDEA